MLRGFTKFSTFLGAASMSHLMRYVFAFAFLLSFFIFFADILRCVMQYGVHSSFSSYRYDQCRKYHADHEGSREVIRRGLRQTSEGSFSAVSKAKFASEYAFESSRRDLHKTLLSTAFGIHNRKLGKKGPGMAL